MGHDAKQNPFSREFGEPSALLDARSRPLQVGDEIIVVLHGPVYMRVNAITPALDPSLPPGVLKITVGASYQFQAARNVPNPEFVRVQTVQEITARESKEGV